MTKEVFTATEDADSEGVEGKFYVWNPEEIEDLLGSELAEKFCYVYDVTPEGNFEGQNILNLPKSIPQCAQLRGWDLPSLLEDLAIARRRLLQARDERIRPGKDDKVLVSWNAMMIESMARAGAVLQQRRLLLKLPSKRRISSGETCVDRMVGCSIAGGMAKPSTMPIWTTTPAWQTHW